MLKIIFSLLLSIHGLIHLMGFAKGWGFGNITQLTRDISKTQAFWWLLTALLFIFATVVLLIKMESWPIIAVIAVFISQVLIFTVWKEAKFGTIANAMILLVAIGSLGGQYFEAQFKQDVRTHIRDNRATPAVILLESDIAHLPSPVQRYLRYTGAIGKPVVYNMRLVFEGEMRSRDKDWFPFISVQYNFFNDPTRLFFMKAKMVGITVPGYHNYQNEKAGMQIRLFGLVPIVDAKGPIMNKAETVTVFNDMCLMAPATLIDKRISWSAVDSVSAKAVFTNGANTISATLSFNEVGQLVNFFSDDRADISDMKQYRFSTPLKDYRLIHDRNVATYGEAIWHYPDGEFIYGKFHLVSIDYNVNDFKK